MGLSGRKDKQKIGDDPRNTKWAKNESNPGFKILSSMGWTPSTTTLGAASAASEPVQSTWKRLPGAILPVIKSTTSGLGANPAQASTSTYLSGAPRFVRGSLGVSFVESEAETSALAVPDPEQSTKLAIVSQGGGFDDLLSRLNQSKSKPETRPSDSTKRKKSKKKSKCSELENAEEGQSTRKSKKSKKRKTLSTPEPEQPVDDDEEIVATPSGPIRISRPINPRVAARAKFINSKKLASSAGSAQAMAEILGIPPAE
ncbi:hypothetical protein PTTG_01205 [Puccinia triticina 1-1 BBBD Race 1]|uniref:G-patch domain-containing protein n=2 Tax=Puccinia triticina TaxID=208348 RepID=A0A0C4EKD0_PUCT1|nr:uncharacterized protein PtA15_10A428 [Puccinia triticina]OAV86477.1 hypothetical protein PTTG_01205 [Puccinia triticina 1-1 BBBD Race 1]WAQ89005.1 hypothetical protein PtA15_10A428 [Puccinia triticina]WAR59061.1 hypothetical protein PtB15_10B403 [Puccinia triticina]